MLSIDIKGSLIHTDSMETMYDRLGDMLNECLEKGEIPREKPKAPKKDTSPESTVIQTVRLSEEVLKAFHTLGFLGNYSHSQHSLIDVTTLPSLPELRSAYTGSVKNFHPDTAKISQEEAGVKITALTESFDMLKNWYTANRLTGQNL